MVTLVNIFLVAALATPALSEAEQASATTSTVHGSEANQGGSGGPAAVAGGPAKLSAVQKQFLYGRKFELPEDARDKKDEFYSPLIINPIRALPSFPEQNAEADTETVRHYQNEIFSNVRDLFQGETAKVAIGKSQFSEKGKEEEGYGEEATTTLSARQDSPGENSSSSSKSRQDGARSLLVVLPFRAEGDHVEELFTKSPLVKMIENDENDEDRVSGTTTRPPFRREILPTTEQNPVTRKRWRPLERGDTTGESPDVETTTESGDHTRNYTNYNDVELITKKYGAQGGEAQNLANHNFEADLATPFPVYKRWRNKAKKDRDEQPEGKDSKEDPETPGKSEKPRNSTETAEKPRPKVRGKGQRRKPTTEGPPKPEDLSKVLDVLPPDMKDLILHIGLNEEEDQRRANESDVRRERPPRPTIDPKSYAVFKPLPLEQDERGNAVPEDMKDFLASFGLLPLGRRVQKSLNPGAVSANGTPAVEAVSGANVDFLPEDLKSLLQSMGLTKNQDKKEPTRIHIFNPSNHSIAHSEEEYEKLNAILSSIKELNKSELNKSESLTADVQSKVADKLRDLNNFRHQNGNLSAIDKEIKEADFNTQISGNAKFKTTAKRATKLIEGPDPLMFSEESLLRNDVKRQAETSSSSSSSSSSSFSSSSSSSSSSSASSDSASSSASASASETTTEESPNIEALKESFGGGETASDDADIESSLPPKRPNGLYLLLDWNSFLEVGTEDDARRVNLRFQPKIGDSRNFLPVSVP